MTNEAVLEKVGVGTVARSAVEYLIRKPLGTELTTVVLAEALGQISAGLWGLLNPAVRQGYLACRKANGRTFWKLGPAITNSDTYEPAAATSDEDRTVTRMDAGALPSVWAYAKSRGAAPFSVSLSTDGRLTAERFGRVVCEFTDEERRLLIVSGSQGVIAR